MTGPRRVHCGALACKRTYQTERLKAFYAKYKAETGRDYRDRYREDRSCQDCGETFSVRRDKKSMRCLRCSSAHQRSIAGTARGRQKHEQAQTPEAAARRRAGTSRRRAARRALERDGESFDPRGVFERDGWRCGICRRRINQRLAYPHPRSASLDHIIPLSRGGAHVRANVRASHLKCNVVRGNRGGGEQLLMIG